MASNTPKAEKHRRDRPRVFVLGAGVSAACGIPVAKDLLRAAMLQVENTRIGDAREIHALLGYFYPAFDPELRNYPNIEDVFNLLEIALKFNTDDYIESTLWSKVRLKHARRGLLKLVTDFLWDRMQNKEKYALIREFAGEVFRKGDVIVTFNWDVTIEHALHLHPDEPVFDYLYSTDKKSIDMFLLKPHGSIDWFRRGQIPKKSRTDDLINLDSKLCVFPYFDFKKNPRLFQRLPIIVPPVSAKQFTFPYLRKVWASVYTAISRASELHIIGYSLPQEDQFSRLVLRRAIRNNLIRTSKKGRPRLRVTIVNPDPHVMVTFARVLGSEGQGIGEIKFKQSYFEDYVSALMRAKP